MKRLLALILVLTVLVITGTIVSADGHTLTINNFKNSTKFMRITEAK